MDPSEGKILFAECLGTRMLLIGLSDDTGVLLTLDQLLSMGVPRFRLPEEASEAEKWRSALRSSGVL